ncbi:MAG: hypothetical protein ACOCVF_00590 [bacterium]
MDLSNKNINEMSLTELNLLIQKIKNKHDGLKEIIVKDVDIYDKLEKKINDNIKQLKELEDNYIKIIDELTSRKQ